MRLSLALIIVALMAGCGKPKAVKPVITESKVPDGPHSIDFYKQVGPNHQDCMLIIPHGHSLTLFDDVTISASGEDGSPVEHKATVEAYGCSFTYSKPAPK